VLPFAKRQPLPSERDVLDTGEIEVIDERFLRSTRLQLDADPTTLTAPVTAVTLPRARVQAIREARPGHHGGKPQAPGADRTSPDSSMRAPVSQPHSRGGPPPSSRRPPSPNSWTDGSARFHRDAADRHAADCERRSEELIPPSRPRDPLVSVDDDDMTRLLSYRPSYIPAPPSSRRPQHPQWAMAPVMTVEAEARSMAQLSIPTPPPSARSLTPVRPLAATAPSSRTPDSLRPVAMPLADGSGPHETPPTSITMRTHILHGRPTATWAAALVVLGVFVGLGSMYARGNAADLAASTAAWLGSDRVSAAGQPVAEDSFASPPAAAPPVAPAPAVAAVPAVERPAVEPRPATDPAAPSDPLAALMPAAPTKGGDSASKPAPSRPTFVAPSSPPVHHWHAAPVPPPAPPPAPAVVMASASPLPQDTTLAAAPAAPPPAPTKATSKSRSKKVNSDDDMQAASASDALARAQLEAALR